MKRFWTIIGIFVISLSSAHAQEPPPPGPPPGPPDHFGIMGFPMPFFANAGDTIDLPFVFFAPVPADSQLSEIAFTLKANTDKFTFDAKVDTFKSTISSWQINVSANPDSIRFAAVAPAGTYFTQGDSMPPAMLALFHGSIAQTTSDGDSIKIEITNAVLKGKSGNFYPDDSLLTHGKIIIGKEPPGGPSGFTLFRLSKAAANPGQTVPIDFVVNGIVPADSQLSRIRGTLLAIPPDLQWKADANIVGQNLSGWSLSVTPNGDKLEFDFSAPAGQFLLHDSQEPMSLFTLWGTVTGSDSTIPGIAGTDIRVGKRFAGGNDSTKSGIAVLVDELFLTQHGQENPADPAMVEPGFIDIHSDSSTFPPPPGELPNMLIGFPPNIEAEPGQPLALPVVLFPPVPADSQVTTFKLSFISDYGHFAFDPQVDTSQTALQNWTLNTGGNADSIWVEGSAPDSVYFVHNEGEPPALLFFIQGNVSADAVPGDAFEIKITNGSVVSHGIEQAIEDSLLGVAKIAVKDTNSGPGPNPGPGKEIFAVLDTMAAPGDELNIWFALLVKTPKDTAINRIRGAFKAEPPELDWLSSGHTLAPELQGWSFDVQNNGDVINFDATAPDGAGLTHDQDQPLPLFSFRVKIRDTAPADKPILITPVEIFITINGAEIQLEPQIVSPGHIFPPGLGPPLPPPPASASHGGRVNLGLYGGTVLDFAFDEDHGIAIAAVAAPQSVFISADSGLTWTAAFPNDSLEFTTQGTLRGFGGRGMKVEASDGYSYAQTSQEAGTLTGAQVSEDGVNWRTLIDAYIIQNLMQKNFNFMPGPMAVQALSTRGPVALVASNNFVFRTTDAGKSWDVSVLPDSDAVQVLGFIQDLALRPNDSSGKSFYATLAENWDRPGAKFYRTEDGKNFTRLYVSTGSDTVQAIGQIMVHPENSDTLWVSAVDLQNPNLTGIWRSYDAGDTWAQIYSPPNPAMPPKLKLYRESSFPGTDHIRLILVGENRYSDDLGDSWVDFSPQNDPDIPRVSAANAGLGHISGTDIYFGQGDGAPSRSTDGLEGTYRFVPTGIEGITIWKIAQVPNDPDRVYLATSIGIAYTSKFTDTTLAATAKWAEPYGNYPINPANGGNLGFTAIEIDPNNTSHVVAANGNGLFVTTNGGTGNNDWSAVSYENVTDFDAMTFKGNGGRISDFAFLSSDSIFASAYCENTLYGVLLLSTDGGQSWKVLNQAGNHQFKAVVVARQFSPDSVVLYAGGGGVGFDPATQSTKVDTGALYKSVDQGATWFRVSYGPKAVFNPAPFPLPINDLAVKPNSLDTLYLAAGENLSNAIARSFDGGTTLETISLAAVGFREGAFEAVAMNKNNPDSIYFAIRRDVLVYDAAADAATTLFRGYPGELTHDLLYDDLTMGSSAGFYEIQSAATDATTGVQEKTPGVPVKLGLLQNYPNPFNPATRIVFQLPQKAKVKLEVFNIIGQRIEVLVDGYREAGKHEMTWRPANLSSGTYFYRLKVEFSSGKRQVITRKLLFLK